MNHDESTSSNTLLENQARHGFGGVWNASDIALNLIGGGFLTGHTGSLLAQRLSFTPCVASK